jgi:4-carboxymuconolactone decarboxylase
MGNSARKEGLELMKDMFGDSVLEDVGLDENTPFNEFREWTLEVLFGEVWEGEDLSKRDRSLLMIGILTVLDKPDKLAIHTRAGLKHGLEPEEIVSAVTQAAFYGGWPCGVNAIQPVVETLEEEEVDE